jgi:hypothetical protein
MGEIKATPRNPWLGKLADALRKGSDFAAKPFGYDNPPGEYISQYLGVPSIATTLDRLSYGEPITNINKANVPLLKPETADAAMAIAPMAIGVGNALIKASPKAQAAALRMMDNAMTPSTLNKQTGAIVWHGSPHKFDKFDSSKIGTGEGAQAYGHGLYLAESPEVAGQYQKTLAADGFLVGDKVFDPSSLQHLNVKSVARKGDLDAAIAKASEIANSGSPVANLAAQDLARLQEIKSAGGLAKNNGSLYKVDLPDEHIAKMLDWDKPLSEQPNIIDSLIKGDKQLKPYLEKLSPESKQAAFEMISGKRDVFGDNTAGTWDLLYKQHPNLDHNIIHEAKDRIFHGVDEKDWISGVLNGQFAAGAGFQGGGGSNLYNSLGHQKLQELGIPGIRYLDGGSRGAGQGTSNFVVFPGNESLLQILERNGAPIKK